jgi:hypothetical protein
MFIRDLDENHRTHYFKTKSEFENRYFKIREEKPEGEEGDEEHSEDGVELEMLATDRFGRFWPQLDQRFSTLRVDLSCQEPNSRVWLGARDWSHPLRTHEVGG